MVHRRKPLIFWPISFSPVSMQLIKLEKSRKILAGGLPVGDRAFVFILEAASNEEVDQMLRNIPMWGSLDWEVTPLQSFSGRAAQERGFLKGLKQK